MYVIWAIVCAVIGALVDQGWTGAVAGAVIGWLLGRQSHFRDELDALRARLDAVNPESAAPKPATPTPVTPVGWPEADPVRGARPPVAVSGPDGEAGVFSSQPPPVPVSGSVAQAPIASRAGSYQEPAEPNVRVEPVEPVGPSVVERWIEAGKRWFTEGNVPVKVGMLVLIAGVGAFLKYAADTGLLRVPMSVRMSLVALVAIAGVAFGWVQRDKRRSFGLALQGGGLGVLVMTVFASYRLYGLIDAGPTFALLLIFVAGMGVLAVLQDALALAVLGLIAGFAAPIIASTGQGNHVALFSYYAVLNLGILGIAWKKAWRVLNVLGFVATFGVGTAWGVLKYSPSLFESTEPFLIFHFLLFLVVPWLHVLRSPKRGRAILDGCLMFGNPIASLLLQGALLDWEPMPLAISALIAAGIYIAIAFAIRKREDMGLLRETWAVLAVAFATIAVPLALSASVTASVFALEGAGLIWLGFRQERRLPRWSGVLLQLVAGVAWVLAQAFRAGYGDMPILNATFVGSLLLVIGAAVGVWQFDRHGMSRGVSSLARIGLFFWALLWWFIGTASECKRFVDGDDNTTAAWLAIAAVTGWLLAEACPRVRKLDLGLVLAFAVPASFVLSVLIVLQAGSEETQLLAGWPLAAIVVTAITGWLSMRGEGKHRVAAIATATLWWFRWLLVFTTSIGVVLAHRYGVGQGWQQLALAIPTLLISAVTLWWPRVLASPLRVYQRDIRLTVGAVMVLAMLFVGLIALGSDGATRPLPFVPVLNPIDLLLIAVLLFIARAISDEVIPVAVKRTRPAVLAIAFFIVATSMTLRAVHHLGGVPWDTSMPSSSLAELSLTVVWSVIGVVAWVLGSRRGQRLLWMAGAGTMAVVLLKLLLVDRGHLGNLFGIASFIAYGLLCTVIGYLAPAPPKERAVIAPESPHAS